MSRRKEKLYHIFYGMKQRCYNPNNPKYNLYGGKGIEICEFWDDYENFKSWSYDNGYIEGAGLSIDRIDSSEDYSPDNCQWISISENSAKANRGVHKNKSKKGKMYAVSPEGDVTEIKNVSEFCRENNLDRSSVSHRLNDIVKNTYLDGWNFYREQTTEGVTTIESI